MPGIVPSYLAKVARAKKHLIELNEAVDGFAEPHPYTVSERVEGKKKPRTVRRLSFTSDPANTDIPIIAADVIYNVRSALDHLMSDLVAQKDRNSAIFPIYFEGVWESAKPGENEQRTKERGRWASDTKTVRTDAVAVLKTLQPPDGGGHEMQSSILDIVNRLSNRDRHEKLPVVASGLKGPVRTRFWEADGTPREAIADPSPAAFLKDKAVITNWPKDAVDVQIRGTPVVGIYLGREGRYITIPEKLDLAARYVDEIVIPRLLPYVRR
jgi:hypothetical protein